MRRCLGMLMAVTMLTVSMVTMSFANDLPTPKQPPGTPTIMELTNAVNPADLVAPEGRYKELADFAIKSIKQRQPDAKVSAYVRPANAETKTAAAIILAYKEADRVVMTFKSNCSVNSQFSVESVTLAEATRDRPDAPDIQRHLLSDIASHWTKLNHDWTDGKLGIPSLYTARITSWGSGNEVNLDVSYDRNQVIDYNRAVASRDRPAVSVATR